MFQLDPRTVIFTNFIYTICVVLFIIISVNIKKYGFKGFRNWILGLLLISLNFLILSLRDIIPINLVIVIPHFLVVVAYVEIKKGLCIFYDINNRVITDYVLLTTFLYALLKNNNDARLRIILLSIFSIFIFIDTILLFSSSKVIKVTKSRIIPNLYIIASLLMLVRLFYGIQWNPNDNPLNSGNNLSIISLLFFITNIVIIFTLFFIVLNKILYERDDLIHQLREASRTDELTGLMNRRGFKDVTKYEVNRFSRSKKGFTFVLADIDFFKKVNDSYGHDAGDYALKIVSKILTDGIRDIDTSARWGGEEFVLLLPETDLEEAKIVLERIRMEIELKYFEINNHKFRMTMSFGAIYTDIPKIEEDIVIKQADENLYKAKHGGRNLIVMSEIK